MYNGHEEIINYCAINNTEEYNRNKVFEELAEFQQVVAKLKTKASDNPSKPEKSELIKEFGDLVYRSMIYIKQQFPEYSLEEVADNIGKHIDKKLTKLEGYSKTKYKGGL